MRGNVGVDDEGYQPSQTSESASLIGGLPIVGVSKDIPPAHANGKPPSSTVYQEGREPIRDSCKSNNKTNKTNNKTNKTNNGNGNGNGNTNKGNGNGNGNGNNNNGNGNGNGNNNNGNGNKTGENLEAALALSSRECGGYLTP